MIRVLQVFGCMNRGGAESMIMELYRHIDRSRIQFDFVVHTTEKCAYDDEILSLGGRIFSVPSFTVKNAFLYKKAWKKLLTTHEEWRIVHGHVRSTASIYLPIAQEYHRYTIAHSHSISSGKGFSSIIKKKQKKRIKADYYMACSNAAGKWLFGDKIVNSDNYHVLPNAIDVSKYKYNEDIRKKVRQEYSCEDAILIGHVGSFYDVKNHSYLIKVFTCIKEKESDAKLMLVGGGYLLQEIKNQVKELGIEDSVIFTGVKSNVNELLQAMDVFVFPSKYEGLGISVVEAQATGLPAVISDRVPKEAILTDDLVTIMNLEDSPVIWADQIIARLGKKRYDHIDEIVARGYDVTTTSKWIEEFYIERNYL